MMNKVRGGDDEKGGKNLLLLLLLSIDTNMIVLMIDFPASVGGRRVAVVVVVAIVCRRITDFFSTSTVLAGSYLKLQSPPDAVLFFRRHCSYNLQCKLAMKQSNQSC